ncbi:MAG TPA: small ribosomal subunit Rsm22 family protein [Bradyrhizobium sp.]|nr:small ribosomal subunit Rsm22 family protein [Bradyrhizobium sp.]
MTPPILPPELRAVLEAKLNGLPRGEIAARAGSISKAYRDGGSSSTIRSETDALAYAIVRMPATYAAVAATLNALCEARPDFAPKSLLDVGGGPGTASWAAATAFASLQDFNLLDINAALQALARDLSRDHARLKSIIYHLDTTGAALDDAEPADLVVASYLIGEIDDAARRGLAERLWSKTRDTLLIIEPGTPAGYARIIALRQQLIDAGAHVAAPCPHAKQCPLQPPDWCHFAQRLPRLRAHIQVKGAELPFEDEKFSYVVLTRTPVARRFARVLAQPVVSKVEVTAKLCTADGLQIAKISRRDKTEYAEARHWGWGKALVDWI